MVNVKNIKSHNKIIWLAADKKSIQTDIDLLQQHDYSVDYIDHDSFQEKTLSTPSGAILIISDSITIQQAIRDACLIKEQNTSALIATIIISKEIAFVDKEAFFQSACNELISKPYGPNELLHKVRHYSNLNKEKSELSIQVNEASEMALLAMENSSDLGSIINFVKSALVAKNYDDLAQQIFGTTNIYSSSSIIEIKGHAHIYHYHSSGKMDNDMKLALLSQKGLDRLVTTGDMVQVNHENFSLLLAGLPIADQAKMGRISDTLVMLCDIANRFVKALKNEEKLKDSEDSRRQFLTTLSHELRTPLNSVLGFSKTLINKVPDKAIGQSGLDALNRIFENTTKINSILTTLIDISNTHISNNELLDTIHLDKLIAKLKNEFKQQASDKQLKLSFTHPEGLSFISDEKKVFQMLYHLIDNAIKFTDEGQVSITVNTDIHPIIGHSIRFDIEDSGIGIAPNNHQRILSEVGQLNNNHDRRHYGVGLGLYYSNLVSKQLNGEISIHSDLGKGSTFTLILPITPSSQKMTEELKSTDQALDDLLF